MRSRRLAVGFGENQGALVPALVGDLQTPAKNAMPVLQSYDSKKTWSRSSNYLGNSSLQVTAQYWVTEGSGPNRRANWKSLPQPARSAPLNYNKSWTEENRGIRIYNYTESNGSTLLYNYEKGPWTSSTFPANSVDANCLQNAEYKAKAKLFDKLTGGGANLLNAAAERAQWAGTAANTVNRLVNGFSALRRKDWDGVGRIFFGDPVKGRQLKGKDIADIHIAIQYGIKPMLSDIYELVTEAHNREKNRLYVFRASGRHESDKVSTGAHAMMGGKSHGRINTVSVAKYMIRATPNQTYSTPAALGLTNPLLTAWEVVPWSFVVDWFIPVGNFLEQLSAAHGWNYYDGCYSTLVKMSEDVQGSFQSKYTSAGWTYTQLGEIRNKSRYVQFTRNTLAGFPVPSLPRFKSPFSTAHFWNSLALLGQRLGHPKAPRDRGDEMWGGRKYTGPPGWKNDFDPW